MLITDMAVRVVSLLVAAVVLISVVSFGLFGVTTNRQTMTNDGLAQANPAVQASSVAGVSATTDQAEHLVAFEDLTQPATLRCRRLDGLPSGVPFVIEVLNQSAQLADYLVEVELTLADGDRRVGRAQASGIAPGEAGAAAVVIPERTDPSGDPGTASASDAVSCRITAVESERMTFRLTP